MSNSSAHGLSELDQLSTELEAVLQSQRTAYFARPVPSLNERKADLLKLKTYLLENKDGIVAAIHADYGNRSMHETLLTELVPTLSEIDHAIGHVKKWMKPQRRQVDLRNYLGASNRVIPQPLGVVGCIVPWNFPINLTFVPLVSIFAAGNRAMVKMSENSRHLCQYLIKTMPGYFSKDKLAFFDETGGVGVAFSKLKFDHLLFTGSGNTGRAVMAAAAQNLCPVTLELGGKSPAIVCADFPLRKAAERLMFVKCLNAGQICTTVDYLFLPKGKTPEFIELAKEIVQKRYPSIDSVDLTSIIDERSFNRLTQALMQAQAQGATLIQLIPGKPWDAVTRKIAPHIVLHAPENSDLWQREIFGPILPILEYQQIEETVQYINQRARPLAVYPFSNDSRVIEVFLERVMSGGVSVNDALFHVGQTDLPFGGV
ncbi:MAG: coniferyl aldehyde dehydrogenase, partial [Betaproteobacteria bacterium]|nr:coniferyl aldehyde dehydrogenase [Betaproteobacteria bacterium]